MSLLADLKTLYHVTLAPIRGLSHSERLESFYGGQARDYDAFRAHLLQGRRELYTALPVPAGGIWLEMGGGTGANLEYLEARIADLGRVYIVDLTPSLLQVARRRVAEHGWSNVEVVEADATTFEPPCQPVDVITFSYSLTMIPDWFGVLEQAWRLLRPGGWIGVVDFYVSRKYPEGGRARHSSFTRAFWPLWFGFDNVFPNPDHLPYLHRHIEVVHSSEQRMRMRYFPLVSVPYYVFIGRKMEVK